MTTRPATIDLDAVRAAASPVSYTHRHLARPVSALAMNGGLETRWQVDASGDDPKIKHHYVLVRFLEWGDQLSLIHIKMCIRDRCNGPESREDKGPHVQTTHASACAPLRV